MSRRALFVDRGGAGGPGSVRAGGPGLTLDITGTPSTYARGGLGGSIGGGSPTTYGSGGVGGGNGSGTAGFSGVVIIRWAK